MADIQLIDLPQRLQDKIFINPQTGCWEWNRYINRLGYGQVKINGRAVDAHRAIFLLCSDKEINGLELDHLCRKRNCVNPNHLEPVTHAENMARGIHATKTHCKNGHEFTPENTRIRGKKRECIKCSLERSSRYRAKNAK